MAFVGDAKRRIALVGLDSMIFVHLVEAHERLGGPAKAVFGAAEAGLCRLVVSILALLEVLVLPKKLGREDLCQVYRETFQSYPNLAVIEFGLELAEIASALRARYGLRTPDAIHLATAIAAGADIFVTEDRRLKKVKEIEILTLYEASGWTAGELHEPRARYGAPRSGRRRTLPAPSRRRRA